MEITIENVCSEAGSSQISDPLILTIKSEIDEENSNDENTNKHVVPLFKSDSDKESSDDDTLNKLLVPRKSEYDRNTCNDDEKYTRSKRKRKLQSWVFVRKFDNVSQVQEVLRQENIWSIHYSNESEEGKKTFYRCNKVKKRGPQCSAKMYLLYDSKSDAVFMYRTEDDHDHNNKESSEHGLSETVKQEINKLIDLHLKPKAIMTALSKIEGLKLPKMTQINNYLSFRRRALDVNHTISLGELEQWIKDNSTLPENPHEVFVTAYEILKDKAAFRFVLSTKYLLELTRDINILHVDSTHKLIWQGYPVRIVGTTDKQKTFHPLCLAVSTTEQKDDFKLIFKSMKDNIQLMFNSSFEPNILVSDAAETIQNAFMEEFENRIIRICWTHVKRDIQSKVKTYVSESVQTEILADIDILHSITNQDAFDKGTEFFLKKYEEEKYFIAYFKDQWLLQNRNWYLGAASASPSTNNALEAFNKVIKDGNTIRERLKLSQFLFLAKEIVNGWSIKYTQNPGEHFIAKYPVIDLKEWTDSYNWAKLPKEIEMTPVNNGNVMVYQVPAGEANKCSTFENPPTNFEEFKEQFINSYTVMLPTNKEEWMQGICSCSSFYEIYMCKHIMGLSIRLNYIIPPVEATNNTLRQKRKRDRPSIVKPALIIP